MAILPKAAKDRAYLLLGLQIAGDFGASIAVPVVLLVLLGQRLDAHFGTGYKLTLAGFALAAVISAKLIYRKAKAYDKKYADLNANEKSGQENTPKEN